MKCIVELFGNDRNGRKMIAWGKRIGCADAGHVFDAERRKVVQTFRPRFHSPRRFAILVSAMLRQSFTDFIFATNTDGSGKAASYVRALDMLGPILTKKQGIRRRLLIGVPAVDDLLAAWNDVTFENIGDFA